jgi:hypothetical protein
VTSARTAYGNQNAQLLVSRMASAESVLIANNDILNILYIGESPNVSSGSSDVTQVPPLGAIVFGAGKNWYAATDPGKTAQIFVIPGATSWTPSPAQVAAQLNALGLAKDTSVQATTTAVGGISGQFVSRSLYSTGAVNLPGAASPNLVNLLPIDPVNLSGSGLQGAAVDFFSSYEVSMVNIDSASGVGVYSVIFQWFNDPADTVPVDQISWSVPSNTGAGVTVLGKGPMRGNYLAIQAASNDGIGITGTINLKLTGSLRDSPAGDDWRGGSVGLGSNGSSAKAWTNELLYSVSLTVPAGSVVRDALLYSGPVKVFMENNSATGTLIVSFAAQLAPNPVLWRGAVPQNGTGANPTSLDLKFPRAPVTMTASNSGASTSGFNVSVVADRV